MEQLIAGLGAVLGRLQPEAGLNDIADWVWLAALVKGEAPPDTTQADHGHDTLGQGALPPLPATEIEPPVSPDPDETKSEPAPGEAAELRTSAAGRAPAAQQRGVPFSTPGGRALPQPLEIARALRPLIRRLPAHDLPPLLDEETSIRRILDSDLWLPAFVPRTRPWLDLALVIEESPSMAIWQRTLHELTLLLSHLGAFRDLRRWRLRTHADDRTVTLHSAGNDAPRRHKELLDPARRRLILIVSDGASPAWHGTTLIEWLRDWGNSHPVALLQMLPDQRLWARGALGRAARWALAAPAAGLANSQLRRRPLSAPPPRAASDPVPAMPPLPMTTLDPARLKAWARLVAGTNPAEFVGFVLRPARRQDPERRSAPIDWEARLADFHATATPLARRLACLLAAAPLRLPVMRLIQHALLPASGQTHLAEFLLSGLLTRVTPTGPGAGTPGWPTEDPELIDYDFGTPEVRHRLLRAGLVTDAVEVQLRIGDYVATHLGGPRQFLAALHGNAGGSEPAIHAGLEPFARVTHEVLKWLGAPIPRQGIDPVPAVQSPVVDDDGGLSPSPEQDETSGMIAPTTPPMPEPEPSQPADTLSPAPLVVEDWDGGSERFRSGADSWGPIRILHLSDLHLRADTAWDADPVLRGLARFIGAEVRNGLVPDLIAITGDLAFAGKFSEYRLARDWLKDQLWPALSPAPSQALPRDRLLVVPGNHDADRDRVSKAVRHIQDDQLAERSQDAIAEILNDATDRDLVLKHHMAYLDFYGDWLGEPQPLPWWERTIAIRGQRLHVAGLDSAWMASSDQDRGRLLLGRYQINQTVLHTDAAGADWRLALLHHPWDYLAEFDTHEARQTIHLHRDLVLRGHLHEGEAFRVLPPDPARACLELAAGCVYDGSRHPNTFQWIELHAAPKRVRVLYRAWVQGAWQIDRNQPGCPDGETEFDFAPADPVRYLEGLWNDTASIAIRGLRTGRPEANRVPIADLYIELQATGASGSAAGPGRKGEFTDHRAASPLHAALAHHRLVIVGDPGCGKTTFLRWVAHCLAADRLGRAPGPQAAARCLGLERARLPLLVRIADWLDFIAGQQARHRGPARARTADWLIEFLADDAQGHNLGLRADDFRRLLCAGEAMILLDGLDEAPDRGQRRTFVEVIECVARAYRDCPLVVTSRPAALAEETLLSGFVHTTIDRLDPAAIARFLDCWSRTLFLGSARQAEDHRRALAAALDSRPEIRRLARNAVMLTALAVVHWNNKRLPEQRAELYESILNWLIQAREARPGRVPAPRCRQLLKDLALAMQADRQGRLIQVTRHWAAEHLAHRFRPGGAADPGPLECADGFLLDEEIDSGIIVRRGHQLRFWHLTFQEYLAAQALAGLADAERTALLLDAEGKAAPALYRSEWRETVLLLGGVLHEQGIDKVDGLVGAVLDRLGPQPADQARAAGLLGALVRDLDPFGYRPTDPRYARCLAAALAVFDPAQAPQIPVVDRIATAEALAQVGDPRLGWAHPARWVELPGGSFLMGAQKTDKQGAGYDPEAGDGEAPVYTVTVAGFHIARFPVVVAEYASFLEDDDHRNPRWWSAGGADAAPQPGDWEEQQAHPSRPVVKISWHQAMAFCAWLTDRLSKPQGAKGVIWLPKDRVVRLPTEAQWEYAARGEPGRRYPWGDDPPDTQRANYDETKVGHATPVGIFTVDCTPEGVLDLAGNVCEWCLDAYRNDFYAECQRQGSAADPMAQGDGGSPRVLRGGTFMSPAWYLRATLRGRDGPGDRSGNVGFRCVLAAPRQP